MSLNYAGFSLYPRGFLGATSSDVSIRRDSPITVDIVGSATRRVVIENDRDRVKENLQVDELFTQISNSDTIGRDFAFREKVYLTALRAFGTADFFQWYVAQSKNPYLGPTHMLFIDDTMKFIRTGRRDIEHLSWMSMLAIDKVNAFKITKEAETFFGLKYKKRSEVKEPLPEVFSRWLSHERGFTDLLFTIKILFGRV